MSAPLPSLSLSLTPPQPRKQAKLVLELVRDLPAVTARILDLRQALPNLNLSALLAQYPWCAPPARRWASRRRQQARRQQPSWQLCLPRLRPPAARSSLCRMLTQVTVDEVTAQLARLAAVLPPSIDVERLIEAEPMLLRADIQAVRWLGAGGCRCLLRPQQGSGHCRQGQLVS